MMQQWMKRRERDDELEITSAVVGRTAQMAKERQNERESRSSSVPH